jgi:hypothetical protein
MSRTFIRQDTQILSSSLYNDKLAVGSTLETAAATLEADLNSVRSQLNRFLNGNISGSTNWYDAITQTSSSLERGINQLGVDLFDVEDKKFLFRGQIVNPEVIIPLGQNYVVLSASLGQAPSVPVSVGSLSTVNGTIVANLGFVITGNVSTASLEIVSGSNELNPKNLILIRSSSNGQPIQDGFARDIYALLQTESGVVDGDVINDTTKQAQLTFVLKDLVTHQLITASAADIGGKSIEYSYTRRLDFHALPESAFLAGIFLDESTAAGTDITLQNAINNQTGPANQVGKTIEWRVGDTWKLQFEDSTGTAKLFEILPNVAGDEVKFTTDTWTVINTNTATFSNGVQVDSAGTGINLGVTAGEIASTAGLTLASAGANNITINSSQEIYLDDGNQTASTWAQTSGIKLSDTTAEWDAFRSTFGEVSLLSGIVTAFSGSINKHSKSSTVVTVPVITAGTNIANGINVDAVLLDYSAVDFTTDVNIYLNGVLCRPAAGATHDVYPGTTQTTGDLKFTFKLHQNDVITMETFNAG